MSWISWVLCSAMCVLAVAPAADAQEMPGEYKAVLAALSKTGDFKEGVLKVNIPRRDLSVTIGGRAAPTPFGFGGWIALTRGDGGQDVMMGDLVLTEDEVNPVMSALLDNGLDVTALHNHFFREQPRVFYMHLHGMGTAADLTRRVKPAIELIDRAAAPAPAAAAPSSAPPPLDVSALAGLVGHPGEQTGPVFKITIGRPSLDVREHGAVINARMGLNTWAAFAGTDADAMVAGDVAMLDGEVTPVLRALRAHGLDIVAIHHHMTGLSPVVIFLHYFGTGPAATLAKGVRAALDRLPADSPSSQAAAGPAAREPRVLFLCPHGAAKSVLASSHFARIARERGLKVKVDFAGTEPDPAIAPAVVELLKSRGEPVPQTRPRKVTAADIGDADVVISLGCDLQGLPTAGKLRNWDVPPPNVDLARTDEAILQRVTALVDEFAAAQGKR